MIFARPAIAADEDAVVEIIREAIPEVFPRAEFSEARARETFSWVIHKPPCVGFVVEDFSGIIGFSICSFETLPFSDGSFSEQRAIFVRPDKRGTRAAAELVQAFERWTVHLRPVVADINLASDRRPEETARFMRRFGFKSVGHLLRKVGEHQHGPVRR